MKILIKNFEYAKLQRMQAKQLRREMRDQNRREWNLHFAWWPVKLSAPPSMNAIVDYEYDPNIAEWRWLEYVERRGFDQREKWSYEYRPLRKGATLKIERNSNGWLRFEGRRWFYHLAPIDGSNQTFSLRETYRNDPDFISLFPSAKYEPHEPYFVKVILGDADAVHLKMMLE